MFFKPAAEKNAALIILGSNFNSTEETNWTFLKDLQQQGFNINVYSIDKRFKKSDELAEYEKDKIKVERLNMEINNENIATKLVNTIPKNTNIFIIIDSIDFRKPHSEFYQLTLDELDKKFPSKEVLYLHYISPIAVNPTFNNQAISLDLLKKFNIDVTQFKNSVLPQSAKPAIILLDNLSKQKPEAANNIFEKFLAGDIPLNLPPEIKQQFKTWLNNEITQHINLTTLQQLTKEFTEKSRFQINLSDRK